MMNRSCRLAVVVAALMLAVFAHVAFSDPVALGTFSGPFDTFSIVGELGYPGELDWYAFTVDDEMSAIRIHATGIGDGGAVRALLFSGDETYIDTSLAGHIEADLAPGSYLIRIDSMDSVVQSYSLVAFNGVETESNDGLLESNDLGPVSSHTQLAASLVPAGDADFFQFAIPQTDNAMEHDALVLETSGPLGGDTAMILYRYSEGEGRYLPILSDDDSGNDVWSRLLIRPQSGDRYVVRIEETYYPLEGIDHYELSILPLALTTDLEPNDTSAHAVDLTASPVGEASWSTQGVLGEGDNIDFYQLTMASSSLLQISTAPQGSAGNYDTLLTLYSADGDSLGTNDNSGNSSWSRLTVAVEAGDYFIAVESDELPSAPLPYTLKAAASPVKIVGETEPNDTDETAEAIAWTQDEALLIEARLDVEGDIDSFKLVIAETATVAFETAPPSGTTEDSDTTLALYDEDLWEIASNDDANGSWSRIEETLTPGTYFIVVDSYFGDDVFGYTLLIAETE